jgi:hypothetical protein
VGVLARIAKAALNEVNKPETYVKGDEFEDFVRKHIFPSNSYEVLSRTHDYNSNKNDFIQSSKEPDFKFKAKINDKIFFVEAKYRSKYFNGAVEWCKNYQLTRYRTINKTTPVFIIIGVDNSPSSPKQIFLIPIKCIKYTKLFHSFLKEYEIPNNHSVSPDKLNRLLVDK